MIHEAGIQGEGAARRSAPGLPFPGEILYRSARDSHETHPYAGGMPGSPAGDKHAATAILNIRSPR